MDKSKLTPEELEIVEILERSPVAWIGMDWGLNFRIICEAGSINAYGRLVLVRVLDSMIKKGVVQHGLLREEQRDEMRKRTSPFGYGQIIIPTYGYSLVETA